MHKHVYNKAKCHVCVSVCGCVSECFEWFRLHLLSPTRTVLSLSIMLLKTLLQQRPSSNLSREFQCVFCFCCSCCNCCCFCCFVCILLSACVTFLFVALCRQGQEKLHLFEITENCVARFEATPFAVYLPCPLSPPTLLPSLFLAFFFCCFLTCLLWRHNLTVLHNNLHSRTREKTSAWICVSRSDREQRGGVAKFKNILHMRVLTRNIFNKLDSPSSLSL